MAACLVHTRVLRWATGFCRPAVDVLRLAPVAGCVCGSGHQCALCVDTISHRANLRAVLALAAVTFTVFFHYQSDRRFYAAQTYDPRPIQLAFDKARTGTAPPLIRTLAVMVDDKGNPISALDRNDLLVYSASSLLCYNPIFGYGLESFPIGSLHPGSALEVHDGFFNLKNPACYLYPKENQCTPGTHFSVSQQDAAKAFLAFRPFPYNTSPWQQLANGLSLFMLFGMVALLLWVAGRRLPQWR